MTYKDIPERRSMDHLDSEPDVLNTRQVARIIGVSEITLREDRSTRPGCLGVPYMQVGRKVVYEKKQVIDWMKRRRITPQVRLPDRE